MIDILKTLASLLVLYPFKFLVTNSVIFWFKFELGFFTSYFLAIIFTSLYLLGFGYIFSPKIIKIDPDAIKPFKKRQKACKPIIIGILVGLFSMAICSLVYSIRHRNWSLFIFPVIAYSSAYFLLAPYEGISMNYVKLCSQLFAGLIAFLVSRRHKLDIQVQ